MSAADLSPVAQETMTMPIKRIGERFAPLRIADPVAEQVMLCSMQKCHKSWVCRRLALIERLSDEAQESIRLGLLPASLGAELARLQRCNQEQLLTAIHEQRLTWRETRLVVAALLTRPKQDHADILKNPRETVLEGDLTASPPEEQGLSPQVRQMRRRLFSLEKICQEATHLFQTDFIFFSPHEDKILRTECARALIGLGPVQKMLREVARTVQPLP